MKWRELDDVRHALGHKLESFSLALREALIKDLAPQYDGKGELPKALSQTLRGLSKAQLSSRFTRDPDGLVPGDVGRVAVKLTPLPQIAQGLALLRTAAQGEWPPSGTEAPPFGAATAASLPTLDVDQFASALSAKLPKPDMDQLAGALAAQLPKPNVDVAQLAGALAAQLPKPNVDVDQLAGALAPKLPPPDVAQLAGALTAQLPKPNVDVDQLAGALAARLPKPNVDVDQLAGALAPKLPQPDVDQLAGALAPKLPQPDVDHLAGTLAAKLPQPDVAALTATITRPLARVAWCSAAIMAVMLGLVFLYGQRTAQAGPAVVVLNGVADAAQLYQALTIPGVPPSIRWRESPVEMGKRRRTVPDRPFKGQARPPCRPSGHEVELGGGCWVRVAEAPCGSDVYEHEGSCYIPVFDMPPTPQSSDARGCKEQ